MLVSHADCVATCLALAFAGQAKHRHQRVNTVGPCGYALFEQDLEHYSAGADMGLLDLRSGWHVQHKDVKIDDEILVWQPDDGQVVAKLVEHQLQLRRAEFISERTKEREDEERRRSTTESAQILSETESARILSRDGEVVWEISWTATDQSGVPRPR